MENKHLESNFGPIKVNGKILKVMIEEMWVLASASRMVPIPAITALSSLVKRELCHPASWQMVFEKLKVLYAF